MSNAEELISRALAGQGPEEYIRVNSDRTITVPFSLRKIAVQFDHRVESVTFECPRYWDNGAVDLSAMRIYINYTRSDGVTDSYIADDLTVAEEDDTLIRFRWTITDNATLVSGKLTIQLVAEATDDESNIEQRWNSEKNADMTVSEGKQLNKLPVSQNPDIVNQVISEITSNILEPLEALIDESGVL